MENLLEQIKTNINKFFWLIVAIIFGAWFYSEYLTTNRLMKEQASLSFSNLSDQVNNILFLDQSSNDSKDEKALDSLTRFKSELDRLIKDYDGSLYSKLGQLIKAKFGLSSNDPSAAQEIDMFLQSSKLDAYNGESVEFVIKEISDLIKARALLNSKEDSKAKAANDILINLIKTSEVVPVEAYVTYVLSLSKQEVGSALRGDLLDSFLSRKPELKEHLEEELSRYGLALSKK